MTGASLYFASRRLSLNQIKCSLNEQLKLVNSRFYFDRPLSALELLSAEEKARTRGFVWRRFKFKDCQETKARLLEFPDTNTSFSPETADFDGALADLHHC
jgi:hypothetical protein